MDGGLRVSGCRSTSPSDEPTSTTPAAGHRWHSSPVRGSPGAGAIRHSGDRAV